MKNFALACAFASTTAALLAIPLDAFNVQTLPVQTYFVPLPETDLIQTLQTVNNEVDGDIVTLISIAVARNNTIIWYDHWEDGYETDVSKPLQNSTLVIGDGDVSNGALPGVVQDHQDILSSGDSIILENTVPVTGDGTSLKFDARDKIQTSFPVAVTRGAYPESPGSLFAGAVEVQDTDNWGTNFEIPVGPTTENSPISTSAFELTEVYVMAQEDNTNITIPDGSVLVLNQGQSESFPANQGDVIRATRPIQTDILVADKYTTWELRWYSLLPREDWSSKYYTPVGTANKGETVAWLYNPSDGDMTVTSNIGGPYTIPPKTTIRSDPIPENGGAQFGSNVEFFGIVQVDADWNPDGESGQEFDWGHPLIPSDQLTSQALIGLGYGCTANNCMGGTSKSVVFVMPVEDATICVDFDNNGYNEPRDVSYSLEALQGQRISDDGIGGDTDMSGALVYGIRDGTCDEPGTPVDIAVAWGQDPSTIREGNDHFISLDLGTVIVPFPEIEASKSVILRDTAGDGEVNTGDVLEYTILIQNTGRTRISAGAFLVRDFLPDGTSYVTGTTTYDSGSGPVSIQDDGSMFPLDGDGLALQARLEPNTPHRISFDVVVKSINELKTGTTEVINEGDVYANGNPSSPEDTFRTVTPLVFHPSITIINTVTTGPSGDCNLSVDHLRVLPNADVTYCLTIDNDGDTFLDTVSIGNEVLEGRGGNYSGTIPPILAPGDTFTLFLDDNVALDFFLNNSAIVTAVPSYSDGQPIPDVNSVSDEDVSSVEIVTAAPTEQPSDVPSLAPSNLPSGTPTAIPSSVPSRSPSYMPSESPSSVPSAMPTSEPSLVPSSLPSLVPSSLPSTAPSSPPSVNPSSVPSSPPSSTPSEHPSSVPSAQPSPMPSERPSSIPSEQPSLRPSGRPSSMPSEQPSSVPSDLPSSLPSDLPSSQPSEQPSSVPSGKPSLVPSEQPSSMPSDLPSYLPSGQPSSMPFEQPSSMPSDQPSAMPSNKPSPVPSDQPSAMPSNLPSSVPSEEPSLKPSDKPSSMPSSAPSSLPSDQPSSIPSEQPSLAPFERPSSMPSQEPSSNPSEQPSLVPSEQPSSMPSPAPSQAPSQEPSIFPSETPTSLPSESPSFTPSSSPSLEPSQSPSSRPSETPSSLPSSLPSDLPSSLASDIPSLLPSEQPSFMPSPSPTFNPTISSPAVQIINTVVPLQNGGHECPGLDRIVGEVGTNLTYCFEISNVGDTILTNIKVGNPVLEAIGGSIKGTIPTSLVPGDSFIVFLEDVLTSDLVNNATVTATSAPKDRIGPNTPLPVVSDVDDSEVQVVRTTTPEPSLAPTHRPTCPYPNINVENTVYEGHDNGASCPGSEILTDFAGASVTYCFVVTNNGGFPLTNLTLGNIELLHRLNGEILGTIPDVLSPQQSFTVSIEDTLVEDLTNTATVTANPINTDGTAPPPRFAEVTDFDVSTVEVLNGENPPSCAPTELKTCNLEVDVRCNVAMFNPSLKVAATQVCKRRPTAISFKYLGGGCDQHTHDQYGVFECKDHMKGPPPKSGSATITVSDKNGHTTYLSKTVSVGESFEVHGHAGRQLGGYTRVKIEVDGKKRQSFTLHTSCSDDLYLNDIFGALQVVGYTNREQGTISAATTQSGIEMIPCHEFQAPECLSCHKRPTEMSFKYVGGGCAETTNHQHGRVSCVDENLGAPTKGVVNVQVTSTPGGSRSSDEIITYFHGDVDVGETFNLDIRSRFGVSSRVRFSTREKKSGILLQDVIFQASCSKPLAVNDQFGSLQLVSYANDAQGFVSGEVDALYTYTVKNVADTSHIDLIVEHDGTRSSLETNGGFLNADDFVVNEFRKIPLVKRSYLSRTTATVTGTTAQTGSMCNATTSLDVSVPALPKKPSKEGLCEGRPREMSLTYLGGDCDQTTNTQFGTYSCTTTPIPNEVNKKVTIIVTNKDETITYFSGRVEVGETFKLETNGDRMESNVNIVVLVKKEVVQTLMIHTSCSKDLFVGDIFGSIQVYSFENLRQGTVTMTSGSI